MKSAARGVGVTEPELQVSDSQSPELASPPQSPELASLAMKDLRRRARSDQRAKRMAARRESKAASGRAEQAVTALLAGQRSLRRALRWAGITLPVREWGLVGETGSLAALVAGHWLTLSDGSLRRAGVDGEAGAVRGAADLVVSAATPETGELSGLELQSAERVARFQTWALSVVGLLAAALIAASLPLGLQGPLSVLVASLVAGFLVWDVFGESLTERLIGVLLCVCLIMVPVSLFSSLWPVLLVPAIFPLAWLAHWALGGGPVRMALRR